MGIQKVAPWNGVRRLLAARGLDGLQLFAAPSRATLRVVLPLPFPSRPEAGALVVDLFGGSRSTLRACEHLGLDRG